MAPGADESTAPDPLHTPVDAAYPAPNTQTTPPAFDPPPAGETGRELSPAQAVGAMQTELNALTSRAALRVEVPPAETDVRPEDRIGGGDKLRDAETGADALELERDALPTSEAAAAEAADRAEAGAPILDSEISQPSTQPVTGADPGDEHPGADSAAAASTDATPVLHAADDGQVASSNNLSESAAADLAPPVEQIFPPAQSDGPRAGPASQSHGRPNHKFHT